MFLRLLMESFLRQKRRKALAGIAILLGTTAVTAMLALATTIGDRIHRELAVYGANIVVTPKAADLAVNIGGVDVHPATGGAYLHLSDLDKLQTIFWHNNITGISPEYAKPMTLRILKELRSPVISESDFSGPRPQMHLVSYWFDHPFGSLRTGAPQLHPWWKIDGSWPKVHPHDIDDETADIVLGTHIASLLSARTGDTVHIIYPTGRMSLTYYKVVGIVTTGAAEDDQVMTVLDPVTGPAGKGLGDELTRVEISARTRPEDAFARVNPDTLSPKQRDLWYCRPYANSIAYQIREAIPNSDAQQVRRVEQSEGTVLSRISGLMWLVSAAALLAAGFAVSAAMATAVLVRRGEIGLMRSLGAGKGRIASLFYAESSILATAAGLLGYLAGSALAWGLGRHIFPADGASPLFNPVLLPVIVALAVAVAIAGSTPAIRSGLRSDVANVLRGND